MRRTFSAADAKNRLADALRQAEAGDLVLITRYRKPVAALIGGDQLEQLEQLESAAAEHPITGRDAETATTAPAPAEAAPPATATTAPARHELRDRAAAGCRRRIEADLARMPEKLKPALRLLRANLFHPRLTVERLQATLLVGAHDFTTEFAHATGTPIHRYLTDRRLEAAARLLVDTALEIQDIGRLVGYSRFEALSRAFKKRYGVRPTIYREFSGRLSPEVASDDRADLPPPLPSCLAGTAAVAPGTVCRRCGGELEAGTVLRVFEDLAPICHRCARGQAPELAAMLGDGEAG